MNLYRIEKVAKEMQRQLSFIVQREMKDPRVMKVTITKVEPSNDLRYAKVYFTLLGPKKEQVKALYGLIHAKRYIEGSLSNLLRLKRSMALTFYIDNSLETSQRILNILNSLKTSEE
jgi:ribosome-binding factor A